MTGGRKIQPTMKMTDKLKEVGQFVQQKNLNFDENFDFFYGLMIV